MDEKYYFQTDCSKLLDKIIWTHKIQCCELERQKKMQFAFHIIRTVFYCVSSTGVITGLLISEKWISIISAIVIFVTALLDNIIKFLSFNEKIPQLKVNSQQLFNLRNELAFNMRKFERGGIDDRQIESTYKDILSSFEAICLVKIDESKSSVNEATKKLKERHDETTNYDIVEEVLK